MEPRSRPRKGSQRAGLRAALCREPYGCPQGRLGVKSPRHLRMRWRVAGVSPVAGESSCSRASCTRAAGVGRWCQRRCGQERLGPGSGRLAERMPRHLREARETLVVSGPSSGADSRDVSPVARERSKDSARFHRPSWAAWPRLQGTALSKCELPGLASPDGQTALETSGTRLSGRVILGTDLPASAAQAGASCAVRDFLPPGCGVPLL